MALRTIRKYGDELLRKKVELWMRLQIELRY